MKKNRVIMLIVLALVMTLSVAAKPKVRILATGGTIAGVAASSTSTAYTAGQATIETLIAAVPEIKELAVCFAAEAGQLQLNVMEPVIVECVLESITWMINAMNTLREKCIVGITVNKERNEQTVKNSIGIVTALNPIIGYKQSTKIAKEALETGRGVYELVLEHGLLTKEQLDSALDPENMLASH